MRKYFSLLIIFAVLEISFALYLTVWREHFWNAVTNKQSAEFIQQLCVFLAVALGCCFTSGISGYLVSLTTIKWREKLNIKALAIPDSRIENVNQRIQEDSMKYPELCLTLGFGIIKAVMYIIVFSISLIVAFKLNYWFILGAYSILGSILAYKVAKPLIALNYNQQQAEATYRNNLTTLNFSECIRVMLGIAKKQKHLTYFQQFYLQVAVVIPLVIIAPAYFSSAMTLGMLMRFNSLSSTIVENMSYGISSWGSINMLLSCRKRLKELGVL
jgi:putative ATP-binding cassette transporter